MATTLNIDGDFTLGTGAEAIFTNSVVCNINVGGDFSYSGSQLFMNNTGTVNLDVEGDFTHTSGTMELSFGGTTTINVAGDISFGSGVLSVTAGSGGFILDGDGTTQSLTNTLDQVTVPNVDFTIGNGSSATTLDFGSNFIETNGDVTVSNFGTLNLSTGYIIGNGNFTLNAGASLQLGSVDSQGALRTGQSGGNLRNSGSRTFTAGSDIIYNGSAAQSLGDGYPTGIAVNLEIDNSSGVTNNINNTTSIVGDLTLTNGSFNIGNNNTLEINADLILTSGSIGGSSSSNLTIDNGSNSLDPVSFTSGSEVLNNLTLNSANNLVITSNLSIENTLTLTSGNLDFQ